MKKNKFKKILLFSAILCIIVLALVYFIFLRKDNFINLKYDEVIDKINNKDSFVLCISATTCSHCMNYKPKLEKVANKYNIPIYYADIDTFTDDDYEKFKDIISFDGSTPTTVFIKDGTEETTATRIEGDVSIDRIVSKLKKNGFIE